MNREAPDIRSSQAYSASSVSFADQGANAIAYLNQQAQGLQAPPTRRINLNHAVQQAVAAAKESAMPDNVRRIVQVFIVDPDPNVPVGSCLLYEGKLHLTELTDQELYFEIDIKTMLDAHNGRRVQLRDKRVKDREQMLEPARIRDLRMQIVTVATF